LHGRTPLRVILNELLYRRLLELTDWPRDPRKITTARRPNIGLLPLKRLLRLLLLLQQLQRPNRRVPWRRTRMGGHGIWLDRLLLGW
jgi:hypothetical protein